MSSYVPPDQGKASAPPPRPRTDVASTLAVSARVHVGAHAALDFPTLRVVTGRASRMALRLDRPRVRFGRSPGNDVVLEDEAASRFHAEITFEDGGYVVTDMKSSNGVLVDGQKVERAILKNGAKIVFGKTELVFTEAESAVPISERTELLARWELLRELPKEDLEALARGLTVRTYPCDTTVHRQDAPFESVLFVVAGEVRVVAINDEGGERTVGTLVRGDHFGERGLLPGQAAACALIAGSELCVLELAQARLAQVVSAKPALNQTMVNEVRARLRTGPQAKVGAAKRSDTLGHLVPAAGVEIVGEDKRLLAAKKKLEAIAKDARTPLVVGQAGTGKRTFARHYHAVAPQAGEPYLEVSLVELEPAAVEAAIFGVDADPDVHDAVGATGYLEVLGTGTLVLGHAERLDSHQQHKLATYLKLGWFHRVYGQMSVKSRTRVVLLLDAPSEAEALDRLIPELREHLKDTAVFLPPLAGRLKDIPLLAEHYMGLFARREGRKVASFSREATDRLVSYAWPGNITELQNVIQRAAIVASEATIIPDNLIFVAPSEKEVHRLNLLRNETTRAFLRNPRLFPALTAVMMAFVAVVFLFTLIGWTRPPDHPLAIAESNPGMLLTWLVWFPLLPFSVLLLGRLWCGVCPIAGFGDLAGRVKRLNLPVPKLLKSTGFWSLIGAYLLVEYLEGALEIDDSPKATALFLLAIVGLAIVFTVLYERRAFCRYLCPLASWLGAYAAVSPFEIRGNKKVCQTQCGEHTCYKGTEKVPGCPMFLYPASMTSSFECLLCTNCVRSCDNRGVQLNVRPPLSELWRNARPELAVAIFALMLVGVMGFHQFTGLTVWRQVKATLTMNPEVRRVVMFSLFLVVPALAALLGAVLSAAASQEKVATNYARYGMAFVPLALAGHMGTMTDEVLGDGIGLLWGYVKGLVGAAAAAGAVIVHPAVVTFLKFLLVGGGITASLIAIVMIARHVAPQNVFARALPHLLVLLVLGGAYLFIFTASTAPLPAATAAQTAPAAATGPGVATP